MKKKKESFRKGFHKVHDAQHTGHPAYIYAKVGDKFKLIGITHSSITDKMKNVKLEQNPDPKDERKAYIRPYTGETQKPSVGRRLKDWKFSDRDKELVEKVKSKPKSKKRQ